MLPRQSSSSSSSSSKRLLPGPVRHGRRGSCSRAKGRGVHFERRRRRRPCSPSSAPGPKSTEYLGTSCPENINVRLRERSAEGYLTSKGHYYYHLCSTFLFFQCEVDCSAGRENIVNWQIVQLARCKKRQHNSQAAIVMNALYVYIER